MAFVGRPLAASVGLRPVVVFGELLLPARGPQVSVAIAGEASWRLTGHWHQSRQPSVPRAVLANGPLVAPLSRQYHNENPVFRLAPGQSRHLRSVSYCAEGIETPLAVTLLCQRRLQLPAAVRAATVQLPAALRAATY